MDDLEKGDAGVGDVVVNPQSDQIPMGERVAVLEAKLKEEREGRQRDRDEFEERLVSLREEIKQVPQAPAQVSASASDEALDDPTLTLAEYHRKHIKPLLDGVKGELDKRSAAIGQALGYIEQRMNLEKAVSQAERTYPDFHQYDDEMIKVAKENPNLDVNAVYRLAKMNINERKVALEEERERKATEARRLATERPSGSGGGLGVNTSLTAEQAVDLAFEKVMGKKG